MIMKTINNFFLKLIWMNALRSEHSIYYWILTSSIIKLKIVHLVWFREVPPGRCVEALNRIDNELGEKCRIVYLPHQEFYGL